MSVTVLDTLPIVNRRKRGSIVKGAAGDDSMSILGRVKAGPLRQSAFERSDELDAALDGCDPPAFVFDLERQRPLD